MIKVITYGTFDLFHEGHYNLLKRAKALGDYLIVGVTTEGFDRQRGKLNVVDSLMTRVENVKNCGFVDEVIIEEAPGQKEQDVQRLGVDIFTVGSDWTGCFENMRQYCDVVYLERTKNISSTMLRERMQKIQRVGIIGTGRIANRFAREVKLVSGMNAQAVYNPHSGSANRFACKWDIAAYDDLDKFYEDIDVVYIASLHETHFDYIMASLDAGKHVLCEKPMTLSAEHSKAAYDKAKEKGLVLLEAVKTAYCPGFIHLMRVINSGVIGEVKNVEACFTKLEDIHNRELTDMKYGGSFTELGSYVLFPVIRFLGKEYRDLRFDSILNESGLDIFTRASFVYDSGMASVTCGLGVKSEGKLMISGTKGYVVVNAPWWKTTSFEVHYEDPGKVDKYEDVFVGDGLRYEISEFLDLINGRGGHEERINADESAALAEIIELFLSKQKRERY